MSACVYFDDVMEGKGEIETRDKRQEREREREREGGRERENGKLRDRGAGASQTDASSVNVSQSLD
jgi:hypothetical protein